MVSRIDVADALYSNQATMRQLLRIIMLLAVVVVALVAYIVTQRARDDGAIYRVSFGLPARVLPNTVPQQPIIDTARILMVQALNYTPHSIDAAFEFVGRHLHPRLYSQFEQWSRQERDYVKTSVISSIGSVHDLKISHEGKVYTVTGVARRTLYIGSIPHQMEDADISMKFLPSHPNGEQNAIGMWLVDYRIPQHSPAVGIVYGKAKK